VLDCAALATARTPTKDSDINVILPRMFCRRAGRDPYVRDVADAGGRSEFVDSGSGGRERREERRQTGAVSLN